MQDIKKIGIGCGAVLIVMIAGIVSMVFFSGPGPEPLRNPEPGPGYTPAPPPPPPKKTPEERLRELVRADQQSDARELARTFLAEGTAEERAAARSVLPSINMRLFEAAASSSNLTNAIAIYAENKMLVAEDGSATPNLKDANTYMKRKIQELRQEQFRALLASGDKAAIDAEIERAWGDPDYSLPEKEVSEYLAAKWFEAASGNGTPAVQVATLGKAAEFAVQDIHSISYWGSRRSPLDTTLAEKVAYNDLMTFGKKSLDANSPVMALAYLSAAAVASSAPNAKNMPAVGTDAWLERQRLLCESYVGVALLAEANKLRWLPPDSNSENKVEILLQHATHYVNDCQRISRGKRGAATPPTTPPETRYAVAFKAWDALFTLYQGKLRRICEREEPYHRLSYSDEMLYEIPGGWLDFLERSCGPQRVFAMIPADLLAEISKEKKTDQEKFLAIKEKIRLKQFSPDFPGKQLFVDVRRKARFDSGKKLLAEGKFDDAFSFFRMIFRDDPASDETLKSRILISAKIDEAGESRNFDTIYALTSFLLGEVRSEGMPPDLAKRLVTHLDAAAEFYKASSKMKRAFMLSLKADLLGDVPEGRTAATQAMEIGFEAVKELPVKGQAMETPLLPSMLKECSVEAIKNQTGYHLMAFYNGPEKFFIRLNPYSKGSLAMRNGEYEIAVVVTSDAIIPYRTKLNYAGGYYVQKYHIVKEGSKLPGQRDDLSDMFMGKFIRLRAPATATATFDPASGMFMDGK